jgi:hypothetical protein
MIRKITKLTKIAIISIVLIISALVISIGLIYYFYPEDSVKEIIRNKTEILLNRKVEIGSLHYSPKGIVISDVTISEKSGDNTETVLVKADEAVITFSLISIIKKDFIIRSLYFSGLELNLIFDQDEKTNIEKIINELKDKTSTDKEQGNDNGEKNIKLSKVILNDCRLKLTNPPKFVRPLEGEYRISSTLLIEKNSIIDVTDTKITLPQKRGVLYPELRIETAGEFTIKGRVKLENASLQWVYKIPQNDPGLPFDVVNGQISDFEITKNYIKGHAKATSTLKNSKSILSADGWCTVEIGSRSVYLKDITGKINSSSANVDNMMISARQGAVKKFGFSNITFQLSDLRQILNSLPSGLSGTAKGGLSFDGNTYNGKIELSNVGYTDNTEIFSGMNTTVDINNNIIRKENIPVTLLGSRSTVSIATTDNKFKNFYLSVNSDKININNINLKGNQGQGGSQGGTPAGNKTLIPVNVTCKLNVQEILYDDFIFKNTNANISATGNIIKINNMETSILSGKISGIGTVNISGAVPAVQTSLRYNNIKIHDITFKNDKLNKRLFGFAEGTANINLIVKDNAAETFKGNAVFTVTKGKVVNTGIQDGLIVFLSELRYKLKDLEFNKIYGNVVIAGNNFQINSFIFNSEDLRLSINGKINKDLIAQDMKMKLEFNNHFIKDLPRPAILAFGEYLSGKWYVIPFSLNGNITESKNIKMLKKDQ